MGTKKSREYCTRPAKAVVVDSRGADALQEHSKDLSEHFVFNDRDQLVQ